MKKSKASGPPTVIDLFCGAGGMALGFRAAGCHILAGVDNDRKAALTFAANLNALQQEKPAQVISGDDADLANPDFDRIYRGTCPDILIGGPPCQGFSRVGRGKLNSLHVHDFQDDPRNRLYKSFLGAVAHWLPGCVVMENVPGILNVRGINVANIVAADMEEMDYRVGYAVLNASWFGVPQHRERVFFLGYRNDLGLEPSMPHATHRSNVPTGYEYRAPSGVRDPELPFGQRIQFSLPVEWSRKSHNGVTVSKALGDLPKISNDREKGVERCKDPFGDERAYASPPKHPYALLMRSWPGFPETSKVDNQVCRANPRDYETFRRMAPGDRYDRAVQIAHARLREELGWTTRGIVNCMPLYCDEYQLAKKRVVPPYPLDGFPDKWRKLRPDEPSWTVTAHLSKDGYSHIHYDNDQARTITVREAARLQSFPDAFTFQGNLGDRFRQIGNAVPPLLAWRLAETIVHTLQGIGKP